MPPDVERTTEVAAPAAAVWERAISPEGINHELAPILRMTMPRTLRGKTIDDVSVGEPLGRAWILLFGFLPVDYDDLALAELEPGRRFLERSSLAAWAAGSLVRLVGRVGRRAGLLGQRGQLQHAAGGHLEDFGRLLG